MIERNHIYEGDCLELMKDIEERSVDLILADLPYQITQNTWDTIIPSDQLWSNYKRILKRSGVIVLSASGKFVRTLWNSCPEWYRYEWIWEKNNATGFLNCQTRPLVAHEAILVFAPGRSTYNPQMTLGRKYKTVRKNSTRTTNYGKADKPSMIETNLRYPP